MKQEQKETNLGEASISSLIAKFALPAILSNLVGSLYNIADQIFIGQKMGTVGNAATNIAFPLVLLMTTFSVTQIFMPWLKMPKIISIRN